jgi:4-hydroxybenzoate polyprenyltransferase
MKNSNVPLVFDLDGTLIKRDFFLTQLILATKSQPLIALKTVLFLLVGHKVKAKEAVSSIEIEITDLLPNQPVMDFLYVESLERQIFIASGAAQSNVNNAIAFFTEASGGFGTTANLNLTGKRKGKFLSELFPGGFDYVGDSRQDRKTATFARKFIEAKTLSAPGPHSWRAKLKAIVSSSRLHHASKNLLVFVPVFTSTFAEFEPGKILAGFFIFLCLSLITSGNYILNDILDFRTDAAHLHKKNRPVASGVLSFQAAFIAAGTLMAAGLGLAQLLIGWNGFLVCALYLALAITYSLKLKTFLVLDAAVLGTLFTLRIFAGLVALEMTLSTWLLSVSWTLFFSLALLKRMSENSMLSTDVTFGRAYLVDDRIALMCAGVVSGFASIVLGAVYLDTLQAQSVYSSPEVLFMLLPLLATWISRTWFLANRSDSTIGGDPVRWALTDKFTLYVAGFGILILAYARFL